MSDPLPSAHDTDEQSEQNKAARLRLARAFHAVFGIERKRTENQRLVMDALERHASAGENAYKFAGGDGVAIIASGIHRDGAQSVMRFIGRKIEFAEQATNEKPKSKVKR